MKWWTFNWKTYIEFSCYQLGDSNRNDAKTEEAEHLNGGGTKNGQSL